MKIPSANCARAPLRTELRRREPSLLRAATRAAAVQSLSLAAGRLEELDRVAGRVLDQDLPAADAVDDVVAEPRAGLAERVDGRVEVVHLQLEAVPAAGLGTACRRASAAPPPRPAAGRAEHEPQVAAASIANVGAGCMTSLNPSGPQ